MTRWEPVGESGRGGDPTIPLPVRDPAGTRAARVVATGTATGRRYDPVAGRQPVRGPGRRWGRRLLWRLAAVALALVMLAALAFGGLMALTPSAGNAEALTQAQDLAHHVAYPGPAVPARFASSLVATEDWRFYSEHGIDLFAVARVAFGYVTGHGIEGGATLYQQLAKLLYTQGRSSPSDEAKQIALAIKLNMTYSHQQILQMYADVAYFGNGFYGLAAASCGYFGVEPAGLSWPQAAMLAGMVQGPSLDDPFTHPDNARLREVHVLGRLVATGKVTQAQANAALTIPLSTLTAQAGQGCSGSN
jgi:membrane peptidoglycan carboxypeptidase